MAIGYRQARSLMRQFDWKMRVFILGDSVEKITLFHPEQRTEYMVRMDSGRKLMQECVVSERLDRFTIIYSYKKIEAEENKEPVWFAVTRWAPEDAVAVAAEQGVTLSVSQATAWWKRNGRYFQQLLYEAGTEILSNMDFKGN